MQKDDIINKIVFEVSKQYSGSENIVKNILIRELYQYDLVQKETAIVEYNGGKNQEYIKRFIVAKAVCGCTKRTLEQYRNTVWKVLCEIGKTADEVTSDDIRYYLATKQMRDHASLSYCNTLLRYLSSFFKFLAEEELIVRSPTLKCPRIKCEKNKKAAFTEMEVELIRGACENARETMIVEVLLSTACRISEFAQIKILYLEAGKRRHSGMNCGEDCPSNEKDRNSLPCCNCERRNAIVKKEEEERKRMKENVKLRNRKAKMGDIQDIQKEIEIIKNEMTDLKKMLQEKSSSQDGLQKEVATQQEQTESEFWMPGYGEPFFAVDAVYGVTECIFEEGDDLDYMMVGNCFATAERAEQVSKKLEFLFRLEQLHDQFCPEFEPDWNDHDTPKIAVHFDCEKDKMISTCTYSEKSVYEVYFDSFETADKVAAILNREVVK